MIYGALKRRRTSVVSDRQILDPLSSHADSRCLKYFLNVEFLSLCCFDHADIYGECGALESQNLFMYAEQRCVRWRVPVRADAVATGSESTDVVVVVATTTEPDVVPWWWTLPRYIMLLPPSKRLWKRAKTTMARWKIPIDNNSSATFVFYDFFLLFYFFTVR